MRGGQVASKDVETKPAEPDQETVEDLEGPQVLENWEFIDRTPTRIEVAALLETLPDWWGVHPADYVDYVQALPSEKRMKVPDPSRNNVRIEKVFNVVTLYFSVAARIQMCREAQELHGWRVEYVPEPITTCGIPGFIDLGEPSGRIVYREYVEIYAPIGPARVVTEGDSGSLSVAKWRFIGRRPGMAWVPATGGRQAKGSNPYEKVETAARGRALAAWGFGVLPGSGVASLEEMLGVRQNAQAMAAQADPAEAPPPGTRNADKPTLVASILQLTEEARQLQNREQAAMFAIVAEWFRKSGGLDVVKTREGDEITELDLSGANIGLLRLAEKAFRQRVQQIRGEQAEQEAAVESGD